MFAKFLDAVTGPAQQIAKATGKQIEREFSREADRAAARLAERVAKESSRRIVGLFGAMAPYEAEPASDRPAAGTGGGLMAGGLFAPPDDDA